MAKEKAQVEQVIDEATGKVYLSPCQVRCPLGIDIQRNHIRIALLPLDPQGAAEEMVAIGKEVYDKSPLFPLLCAHICGLCENECNYKDETGSVRRRMVMSLVADEYVRNLDKMPALPKPTKDKVAIIGGGPGGLNCAFELAKKGYKPTIIERKQELGGALRYIPRYRLSRELLDTVIKNLLRIAHVEARLGVEIGSKKGLDDLKKEGYKAVFIATGTPAPRPLTFGRDMVAGADVEGVEMGLNILYEANQGLVAPDLYKGKKVVVVGGGNVAFDVARTARRLGTKKVTLICLECADKSVKDGVPADVEEIEGAEQEGIKVIYSRGVSEIISKGGKVKKLVLPKCTSVFDADGRFNPQCDASDTMKVDADVLLVTIGQGPERNFFQDQGLLNDKGRLDVDPVTLMSSLKKGVFIGGDVKMVGFASEAMRDGAIVAESIDRYITGKDMKADRTTEYEEAPIPLSDDYRVQPELKWEAVKNRLNFDSFEKEYTLDEVRQEARRCLCCGPCDSCRGCVVMELRDDIPEHVVDDDLCSGCGVCVTVCPYDANKLEETDEGLKSTVDLTKCKRCGVCISACPSQARTIKDSLAETIAKLLAQL